MYESEKLPEVIKLINLGMGPCQAKYIGEKLHVLNNQIADIYDQLNITNAAEFKHYSDLKDRIEKLENSK